MGLLLFYLGLYHTGSKSSPTQFSSVLTSWVAVVYVAVGYTGRRIILEGKMTERLKTIFGHLDSASSITVSLFLSV